MQSQRQVLGAPERVDHAAQHVFEHLALHAHVPAEERPQLGRRLKHAVVETSRELAGGREEAFDGLVAAGYGKEKFVRDAVYDFVIDASDRNDFPYYSGDLSAFLKHYGPQVRTAGRYRKDPQAHARKIVEVLWGKKIRRTAKEMARALNKKVSNKRRLKAITDLRGSSFFQTIGTSLMVHMINSAELDVARVMYLELVLEARDHHGVRYTFGTPGERELYDAVRFIRAVLSDRDIDMREPGETESVVSRIQVVKD